MYVLRQFGTHQMGQEISCQMSNENISPGCHLVLPLYKENYLHSSYIQVQFLCKILA
jgi:hypothetical protein